MEQVKGVANLEYNLGDYGSNMFFNHKKRVTISTVFNIGNVHQGFDSIALAPLSAAIPTACLQKNRNSYLEGPCKPFCPSPASSFFLPF